MSRNIAGAAAVAITLLGCLSAARAAVDARVRAIRDSGGNPFFDYQVPEAAISLKQGFGRLIRTASDTGTVVILDPSFAMFAVYAQLCGARAVTIPFRPGGTVDVDDILQAITPGTRILSSGSFASMTSGGRCVRSSKT